MAVEVSVIVLNWNGRNYIQGCLKHIMEQSFRDFEVILVDNNSQDGSLALVEAHYPHIRIIKNRENLGFSRGMNIGIKAARGRYILPLNVDVFLDRNFIKECLMAMKKEEERGIRVGMIGAMVYKLEYRTQDTEYRIQDTEHRKSQIPNPKSQTTNNIQPTIIKTKEIASTGSYLKKRVSIVNSPNKTREEYVFGPSGCCPFFKKAMLEDIKLPSGEYYDESYFIYWEDVDLYWRAQLLGWKCLFSPRAIAWHALSGTMDSRIKFLDKPQWIQREALKNRYSCIIKNTPWSLFFYLLPYLILTEIFTLALLFLKKPRNILLPFEAVFDTMGLLAKMWEKRMYIQSRTVVSTRYLKGLFYGF